MQVTIDQVLAQDELRIVVTVSRKDFARLGLATRRRLMSDDVQTVLDAVAACYAPRKGSAGSLQATPCREP